jgi:hypothetical protein
MLGVLILWVAGEFTEEVDDEAAIAESGEAGARERASIRGVERAVTDEEALDPVPVPNAVARIGE